MRKLNIKLIFPYNWYHYRNVKVFNDKGDLITKISHCENQNILIDKCGITKTKLGINKKTNFVRIIEYNGYKNIFKIVKFIYSNSPICLERKRKIAFDFLLTKFPKDKFLNNLSFSEMTKSFDCWI